jgi:hypothetical protein
MIKGNIVCRHKMLACGKVLPNKFYIGLLFLIMGGRVPDLRHVVELIASFLAGFSLKWILVVRSSRVNINQQGNIVGGNLAGRDVKSGRELKN